MKLPIKLVTVFAVTLALHLLIWFSGAIPFFDYRFFDVLSSAKTSPSALSAKSTVVVEIDEESLRQAGQWPWPRIVTARLLQQILLQKPAVVGFDIFFPEADRTSPVQIRSFYQDLLGTDVQLTGVPAELEDHDRVFARVLQSGPTVLPVFLLSAALADQSPGSDRRGILSNTPVLQAAASGSGFINAAVDSDGVFRRQPLLAKAGQQEIPSLVLAMLRQIDPDLEINSPQNSWQPYRISFADRRLRANSRGEVLNLLYARESFSRISAAQLLNGQADADLLTGKLVLIGASAAGLYDQYMTPRGNVLPGVFAHAALLENLLQGKSLYQPEFSKDLGMLFSCLLSLLIVWLVFGRRYLLSWGLYLAISLAVLLFGWLMLEQGLYLSVGYFLTPFSFLFFSISLFFAVLHYVERKRFLEELDAAHSATIDSMTMVAENRDLETGAHILRTKEYVKLLAEAMARNGYYSAYLTPYIIDLLYRAAPLHDIGKVGIPDAILQKPGPLDGQELQIMRSHVSIGQSIIENAINSYNKTNEFLTIAANITCSHHEKWDGSGYPLGLAGDRIPIEGRMMALADVYDALISRRCYKEPYTFQQAEVIIGQDAGKHFDPELVRIFMDLRTAFRIIAEKHREDADGVALPFMPAVIDKMDKLPATEVTDGH